MRNCIITVQCEGKPIDCLRRRYGQVYDIIYDFYYYYFVIIIIVIIVGRSSVVRDGREKRRKSCTQRTYLPIYNIILVPAIEIIIVTILLWPTKRRRLRGGIKIILLYYCCIDVMRFTCAQRVKFNIINIIKTLDLRPEVNG